MTLSYREHVYGFTQGFRGCDKLPSMTKEALKGTELVVTAARFEKGLGVVAGLEEVKQPG